MIARGLVAPLTSGLLGVLFITACSSGGSPTSVALTSAAAGTGGNSPVVKPDSVVVAKADRDSEDEGDTDAGGKVNSAACGTCIQASCSAEFAACGAGSACVTFSECIDRCYAQAETSPDTCTQACETANPTGVAPLLAAAHCQHTKCGTQCDDFAASDAGD